MFQDLFISKYNKDKTVSGDSDDFEDNNGDNIEEYDDIDENDDDARVSHES